MEVFLKLIVMLIKINAKIQEDFLSQKKVFFLSPKVQKNAALSTMAIQHIFNES